MASAFVFKRSEDGLEFFFKEENLSHRGSFIDIDHLGNEKVLFFSPSVQCA
jgi:hypothetical protein